jgi:hypothetical protein
MATWALIAVATSCESRNDRQPSAPTGLNPSISVLTVKLPGITCVGFRPWVMAIMLARMLIGKSAAEA